MAKTCSTRRQLLLGMGGAALYSLFPITAQASRSTKGSRSLAFYNLHTGEHNVGTYWIDGQYQAQTLQHFDHVLRDFRQNQSIPMDKNLFDLLYKLQNKLDHHGVLNVISGYRSPKTNAYLASHTKGVAKHSYHMKGMAMDIAIPGVKLADVRDAAIALKLGGVGFYPDSGFVHIDTGPVRHWG